MTIAYFDCFSGASGDMIVGALLGAGASLERLRSDLAVLGLDDVRLESRQVTRQGIVGTKFEVIIRGEQEGPSLPFEGHAHSHAADHHHEAGHHPPHRTLADVEARLARLPEPARGQAIAIFRRLADAEARVHGATRDAVHFHEVGQDDAITDVAAAVLCLAQLGVTEVQCSALPLGSGLVRCAHGVMPVPVPAVAELVAGLPTYDNGERGELVTPTGAAILATLATRFGPPPAWRPGPVGYGAGTREGERVPNLLRVTLGQPSDGAGGEPAVREIQANIDDLNPQFYAPLTDRLFAAGALDVTLTPTIMKKGRPGIVLAVLCPAPLLDACCALIFRETTTLGLRHQAVERRVLDRTHHQVSTPWGEVGVKVGLLDGEAVNVAPEYEDCRRVAEAAGRPVKEVWQEALAAARRSKAE